MKVYQTVLFLIVFVLCNSCATKRSVKLYNGVVKNKIVYDAIIVPGVPFKNGGWDSIMKARVLWSVFLYKNQYTRNIIYSGSAVYTRFIEAKIMGLYAQQLGVKPEHILYDTLAKHSTENVYYSYLLSRKYGFKKIALATDPFQSLLLKGYTKRRFSSQIDHIPVNFKIIKTINGVNPMIDSILAFKADFESIKKLERPLKRFWGTLGKQVYYGPDGRLGKL